MQLRYFIGPAAIAVALAACASNRPPNQTMVDVNASPLCADPYLEIQNHSNKPLDIYGYANGGPVLIGRASASDTRVTLLGTPLERQAGGSFYAMADGVRVSTTTGSRNGSVTLTRKCARS